MLSQRPPVDVEGGELEDDEHHDDAGGPRFDPEAGLDPGRRGSCESCENGTQT